MTRWIVSLVIFVSSLGWASPVDAYPIDNGVEWAFEATAQVTGDFAGCCAPLVANGQHVTGRITVTELPNPPGVPGTRTFAAIGVDLPGGATYGIGGDTSGAGFGFLDKRNGNGTVDRLNITVAGPDFGNAVATLIGMNGSGLFLFPDPGRSFTLEDLQGAAWTGLNPRTGDFFPDAPPDIALFETARFVVGFQVANEATQPVGSGSIVFQIDRFVTEPSGVTLVLGALLGVFGGRGWRRRHD